ncbi:MAG TPA: hypothetical protein VG714_02730 [Acidobacteriaceae bacterium]|nr:hypothetical protein [Acidobacteriaceae bacterium]
MQIRLAEDAVEDLRSIWLYVAAESASTSEVQVLRIVHGRRDLPALFDL